MQNLKWYIHRARIMNIKEIIHRVNIRRYDNKIIKNINIKKIKYKLELIKLPKLNIDDNLKVEVIEYADEIIKGKFKIFNLDLNLNYENKFNLDPITKQAWDKNYFSKISFRMNNNKDPKLIWELNKQQYLVSVALAYKVEQNDKYAEYVISEIDKWINENDPYIGINWTSGLEIALRCLSWIFSLSLIGEYLEKKQLSLDKIIDNIILKTEFLYNRLSLYSSANNHLIGELTAILYSSIIINCEYSNRWFKKSFDLLNRQIKNQFYIDGVNKEQSINYQLHTMELYFLCQYILEKKGQSLNKDTIEILIKSAKYINDLSEFNGDIFNIGDEDGGSILKTQKSHNNIIGVLQMAAILFNRVELINNKQDIIDSKLMLLYGEKYIDFLGKIKINDNVILNDKNCITYNNGGVYIRNGSLKNLNYKLYFDFGNIGMHPLNAHAHNDIFSVNLNINNIPFLIDSGTYKYHLDKGYRDYFRGVSAHNTISIDGKNQFQLLGPFMCSKSPKIKKEFENSNKIKCISDMYKELGCYTSRELVFDNDRIIINDYINNNSNCNRRVNIYFNLDSNIRINRIENKYVCFLADNISAFIEVDSKCNSIVYSGYKNSEVKMGWQSKSYYELIESNVIVCEQYVKAKDNICIKTIIGI